MAFDLEAISSLPASILALLAKAEAPELLRPAPPSPPMATVPMGPASGQISTDATGPAMPALPPGAQPSFLQPSGMTNAYEPSPPIDRPAPAPSRPLQQSLVASGASTPAPAVPSAPTAAGGPTGAPAASGDPYADQLAQIRQRRAALEKEYEAASAPPDYSEMQEQMQQRRRAYLPGAMAAVLAGMGPQAGKVLQEGMMARADQARQPMRIEGGQITAEGEVMLDPAFQKQRKIEALTRRIDAIDKLDATITDQQQKVILAREKYQAEIELRREIAAGRREMAAAVRAAAGGSGREWVQMKGPDGVEYLVNRVTGERRNPWGDMSGMVTRPDALPASAPAELKTRYSEATAAVNTMPAVVELVKKNPQAFGARVGYAEIAGGALRLGQHQVPLIGKELTPAQQAVRAEVFLKYGKLMHDLIGSAQTVTEQERLRSFVPAPGEDWLGVTRKMEGGIAEARRIRAELARQYGVQPGGGVAPPGAPPGAPPPGTPARGNPDSYYARPPG